jgi:hypothetical protein
MSPAPTTSPISVRLLIGRRPPVGGEDGVLDVAVEVERPRAALAADAGLAVTAEWCSEIADEEAVDPDGSCVQPGRDPFGAFRITGFWELFNAFYSSGRKIALAGLVAPKELPHLDGHLTSRLLWGLVARMDVSDDESRRMILKKLAEDRQMALPDEVIDQMLLRVRRDIPSLVYALETINRYSISTKRKVGLRLAKESMDSMKG